MSTPPLVGLTTVVVLACSAGAAVAQQEGADFTDPKYDAATGSFSTTEVSPSAVPLNFKALLDPSAPDERDRLATFLKERMSPDAVDRLFTSVHVADERHVGFIDRMFMWGTYDVEAATTAMELAGKLSTAGHRPTIEGGQGAVTVRVPTQMKTNTVTQRVRRSWLSKLSALLNGGDPRGKVVVKLVAEDGTSIDVARAPSAAPVSPSRRAPWERTDLLPDMLQVTGRTRSGDDYTATVDRAGRVTGGVQIRGATPASRNAAPASPINPRIEAQKEATRSLFLGTFAPLRLCVRDNDSQLPLYAQQTASGCGVACLRMLIKEATGQELSDQALTERLRQHGLLGDNQSLSPREGMTALRQLFRIPAIGKGNPFAWVPNSMRRFGPSPARKLKTILGNGKNRLMASMKHAGTLHGVIVDRVSTDATNQDWVHIRDPGPLKTGCKYKMPMKVFRQQYTGAGVIVRVQRKGPPQSRSIELGVAAPGYQGAATKQYFRYVERAKATGARTDRGPILHNSRPIIIPDPS